MNSSVTKTVTLKNTGAPNAVEYQHVGDRHECSAIHAHAQPDLREFTYGRQQLQCCWLSARILPACSLPVPRIVRGNSRLAFRSAPVADASCGNCLPNRSCWGYWAALQSGCVVPQSEFWGRPVRREDLAQCKMSLKTNSRRFNSPPSPQTGYLRILTPGRVGSRRDGAGRRLLRHP